MKTFAKEGTNAKEIPFYEVPDPVHVYEITDVLTNRKQKRF
jgi:hypothetical protein